MASRNFITYWLLHKKFSRILSKWKLSNFHFSIFYKMLEKHPWNRFLLYLLVEILKLVHEIVVSRRCSRKEVSWKTSQKLQKNTRSSHHQVFCQKKDVLTNFCEIHKKHICRSLFFNKVAGWKFSKLHKQPLEIFCKRRCS